MIQPILDKLSRPFNCIFFISNICRFDGKRCVCIVWVKDCEEFEEFISNECGSFKNDERDMKNE